MAPKRAQGGLKMGPKRVPVSRGSQDGPAKRPEAPASAQNQMEQPRPLGGPKMEPVWF